MHLLWHKHGENILERTVKLFRSGLDTFLPSIHRSKHTGTNLYPCRTADIHQRALKCTFNDSAAVVGIIFDTGFFLDLKYRQKLNKFCLKSRQSWEVNVQGLLPEYQHSGLLVSDLFQDMEMFFFPFVYFWTHVFKGTLSVTATRSNSILTHFLSKMTDKPGVYYVWISAGFSSVFPELSSPLRPRGKRKRKKRTNLSSSQATLFC